MPTTPDDARIHARMDDQPMPSDEEMGALYAALLRGDMQ